MVSMSPELRMLPEDYPGNYGVMAEASDARHF